jgi:AraC-like DNA-binding protein
VDVLSDVLAAARLGSVVIGHNEYLIPWGCEVDIPSAAIVHVVQRGSCWLKLRGERTPVLLADGDIVLLPGGVAHSLGDTPRHRARPFFQVKEEMIRRLARLPEGSRDTTAIFCAKYRFEHVGPHPLLSILPRFIHVRAREAEKHPQLQLLQQLLRLEARHGGNGKELVLPRLVDSLLVYIVRAWLEDQPAGDGGWFGALRDARIAKALSLMHERPAQDWTVASLARAAAQSRAGFAKRFLEFVGETPLAYLTRWRMFIAVKMLRERQRALADISTAVGYESSAAFSKAFQRQHGVPPGRFRATLIASEPGAPRAETRRRSDSRQAAPRARP